LRQQILLRLTQWNKSHFFYSSCSFFSIGCNTTKPPDINKLFKACVFERVDGLFNIDIVWKRLARGDHLYHLQAFFSNKKKPPDKSTYIKCNKEKRDSFCLCCNLTQFDFDGLNFLAKIKWPWIFFILWKMMALKGFKSQWNLDLNIQKLIKCVELSKNCFYFSKMVILFFGRRITF